MMGPDDGGGGGGGDGCGAGSRTRTRTTALVTLSVPPPSDLDFDSGNSQPRIRIPSRGRPVKVTVVAAAAPSAEVFSLAETVPDRRPPPAVRTLCPSAGARFSTVHVPGISPEKSSLNPVAQKFASLNLALPAFYVMSDTVRHVIAGTAARTMAQVFVHPMDTIKTRMQVSNTTKELTSWKASSVKLSVGKRSLKFQPNIFHHGVRDIYLGVSGAFLGTIPTAFVYFCAYESCSKFIAPRIPEEWGQMKHLLSASCGALASAFLRVPTDTMRHRVQAYMHPNVFNAASTIVSTSGVRGLYSGFLPTLCRDVPEIAIQFTVYESLRTTLASQRKDGQSLQTWEHLALGGMAGAIAATCTMPIDFLKTTMQCSSGNASMFAVASEAVKAHGPAGLFAGMGPRVAQTTIMSAAFFSLFEFWKMQLKPASQRPVNDRAVIPKLLTKRRDHVWKRQFVYR